MRRRLTGEEQEGGQGQDEEDEDKKLGKREAKDQGGIQDPRKSLKSQEIIA